MLHMKFLPLISFPAVLIGAIVMKVNGVPISIWLQNIIITILGTFISLLIANKIKMKTQAIDYVQILVIYGVLVWSLFAPGIGEVHRWIALGPIKLYISSICLPWLLIILGKLVLRNQWWVVYSILISISFLLLLQPDASAVTAFAVAVVAMIFNKINGHSFRYFAIFIPIVFIITSWVYLDRLAPVPYVEDILSMAKNLGIGWLVIALFSLLLLVIPFLLFPPKNRKATSISLSIYFTTVFVTTYFGNFPVPLMGYGISPIIGYLIAIQWFVQAKKNDNKDEPNQ
ncbi:hypothetical protein AALF16_06970 [Bacillus cereus]|uniref:hypothetical protein n=1 Tax=Bacillus cereus TaxID=1396 RepID=UPI00356CADD0